MFVYKINNKGYIFLYIRKVNIKNMLISKKIVIGRRGNNNLKYYSDLGYDTSLDNFEIDINHLSPGSKYLVDVKCDFCNNEVKKKYYLYLKNISSHGLFACSPKCGKNKTLHTNIVKYGVAYPNQSKEVRDKTIKTNLDRYGFESPMENKDVQNKMRETNLEKYGVEWTLASKEVRDKIKETNLEKYGVDHNFKSPIVRDKIKNTLMKNYGVDNPSKSEEIKDRKRETSLKNWGVDSPSKSEEIKDKKRLTTLKNFGVEYPMQSSVVMDKSQKTMMDKYGVDHNSKLDFVKENMKSNNLKNWGVEYTLQSKEIRDRIEKTNLENWGVKYILQSKEIRDRIKKTNLKNWGVEYTLQSSEIRDRIVETNLEKWGVDNPSKSEEIKDKKKETCLGNWGFSTANQNEEFRKDNFIISKDDNYIKYLGSSISLFSCDKGHEFEMYNGHYYGRVKSKIPLCTICYPIGNSRSIKEDELYSLVASIYDDEIIQSYRDVFEIDVYLPALNIGFEFNGLYWHSEKYKEKTYHLDKSKYFSERGIRIIHIWEDDWDNRRSIIDSQVRNWLGLTSERVYARKCKVLELKNVTEFLNDNHIQGVDQSCLKLGLYLGDELVSVMTFNRFEGRKRMEEGGWNLSRFCNKIGFNVIGGASKLLNHFKTVYNPSRIVSYADRDWSQGDLYYTLGFEKISESSPDYKYLVDNRRVHKSNYRKSKLGYSMTETEYVKSMDIERVWDCGKIKFELKIII